MKGLSVYRETEKHQALLAYGNESDLKLFVRFLIIQLVVASSHTVISIG